jgi:hypothetical protein
MLNAELRYQIALRIGAIFAMRMRCAPAINLEAIDLPLAVRAGPAATLTSVNQSAAVSVHFLLRVAQRRSRSDIFQFCHRRSESPNELQGR